MQIALSHIGSREVIDRWNAFATTLIEHPSFSEVFAPLFVGGVLAYLGMRFFFKRKAYELVQKRYLDDTMDNLVDDCGTTLANFRSNWHDGNLLLRSFNEGVVKECKVELGVRQRPGSFNSAMVQRLERLVGDERHSLSWMVQALYVFVDKANSFLHYDLVPGTKEVQKRIDDKTSTHGKEHKMAAAQEYQSKLILLKKQARPYNQFLAHLGELAGLLEQQKFTLRTIRRFRNGRLVREWLSNLNKQRAQLEALLDESARSVGGSDGAGKPDVPPGTFDAQASERVETPILHSLSGSHDGDNSPRPSVTEPPTTLSDSM